MTHVDNEAEARLRFAGLFSETKRSGCVEECPTSETGHHPDCAMWDPHAGGSEAELELQEQPRRQIRVPWPGTTRRPRAVDRRKKGWLYREVRNA